MTLVTGTVSYLIYYVRKIAMNKTMLQGIKIGPIKANRKAENGNIKPTIAVHVPSD